MSDFLSNEILKRHWSFLETEESMQKLEERQKLEVCLKEFLCTVPHDHKFFLPETGQVLRKSIYEMEDFTAYKAIIGFEAISQYANNLFTKPWRKEFRVLKMYSGYFQHEVKSNLLDSVSLFEAMGYRRLSNDILILDGPICPDQVANVSRDAMAAYVECQIIKHIYTGLIAMGLTCTWQDVFHYREKNIGGSSQAIKGLSYAIQERRLRKEKVINAENTYAAIQHSPQDVMAATPMASQCPNCAAYHMAQSHYMHSQVQNTPCALHSGAGCALHPTAVAPHHLYNGMSVANGKLIASYPQGTYQQLAMASPGAQQPHMSHSRSLEHYNEPPALLPHRHSFDHQQQGCSAHHHYQQVHAQPHNVYEPTYDCLDGISMGSTASYAAVGNNQCMVNAYEHPYNVSGNRYPLPYNISNQLNSHYATPVVTCNGIKGDAYTSAESNYATVSKTHNCNYHAQQQQQPPLPPARVSSAVVAASKDFQAYRQRSFPPDHLIDFDDRAPLTSHDFHAQLHTLAHSQNNSFDYERDQRIYEQQRNDRHAVRAAGNYNATYAQPRDVLGQHNSSVPSSQLASSDDMYGGALYSRPLPRGNRGTKGSRTTDKYLRNLEHGQDCVDNNRKLQAELKMNGDGSARRKVPEHGSDRDVTELCYEFDDFIHVGHSEHPQRSPTQETKNQDGVGSFASWDYVYQNLDRSGYTKDLGDRGDLLVQSLDLDSHKLANGVGASGGTTASAGASDKRRSTQVDANKSSRQSKVEKVKTIEKPASTIEKREPIKASIKQEKSILKHKTPHTSEVRRIKSALKSPVTTAIVMDNNNVNGNVPSTSTTSPSSSSTTTAATATTAAVERKTRIVPADSVTSKRLTGSGKQSGPVATQVIVTSPNEWSCRFCTFLNPDTKRICEMCCHSKDFNAEATVQKTPTCV